MLRQIYQQTSKRSFCVKVDSTHLGQQTDSTHLGQQTDSTHSGQQTDSTHLGQQTDSTHLGQQTDSTHLGQQTDSTHFGYKTIHKQDKKKMVAEVFHGVAEKYDVMNDVMSGGVHRLWKDYFVDKIGPMNHIQKQMKMLDLAGGTGDIAFRLADKMVAAGNQLPEITVCDINASMLDVGEERARQLGYDGPGAKARLKWIQGDAEKLAFESDHYDLYTIAFGIRNVTDIPLVLREAHRVLKKGGRFMCLEFSKVENPVLGPLYDAFSFNVIPQMGQAVAGDRASYQYLVESIRKFPPQNEFKAMIEDAGFSKVTYTNLTGGVAAIHSGFKL